MSVIYIDTILHKQNYAISRILISDWGLGLVFTVAWPLKQRGEIKAYADFQK